MNQPLLSIGMIVKNEERCLEKCLKALEPLRQAIPCELVIADTGSTDKTKEIAEKYADILFDFEWVNDFSKARNAVMNKCSGKWYLTVDADEYLSSSTDELVEFLTGPLAQKNIHASIIQRNFTEPDMKGTYSDFNALRMVRMDTGKRYEDAIHETFHQIELNLTHILKNTIFDHDGYTDLTPNHLKEKSKRNLELLENELKNAPCDIRRVLQCIETPHFDINEKLHYVNYAKQLLQHNTKNVENMTVSGAPCAKEVIKIMTVYNLTGIQEFVNWAFEYFSGNFHIYLDAAYFYIKHLFSMNEFLLCIDYCKLYLVSFEKYKNKTTGPCVDDFNSPIKYNTEQHKLEIETFLANALIKLNRNTEAIKILNNIDLSTVNETVAINWFSAILSTEEPDIFLETTKTVIGTLLEKQHSKQTLSNDSYNFAISTISKPFSCNPKRKQDYNVFKLVPGTIGLSVSIANSKTKEEAEEYLTKIDVWEEFMPLALSKALELNAKLPKEFYLMDSTRLTYLIHDLILGVTNYIDSLNSHRNTTNELYELAFLFKLLSTLLVSTKFDNLTTEQKSKTIDTFRNIAKNYLSSCYNEALLQDEELMQCLDVTSLFSWYLVKANSLKDSNPLEYIKTLRTALKKVPQAKDVIEFLIEEFKNEEELKRQEKIKNTSPELLQMAEQLKTMLAALPPNSPELLAIKQSPMYKQVAFLIED